MRRRARGGSGNAPGYGRPWWLADTSPDLKSKNNDHEDQPAHDPRNKLYGRSPREGLICCILGKCWKQILRTHYSAIRLNIHLPHQLSIAPKPTSWLEFSTTRRARGRPGKAPAELWSMFAGLCSQWCLH